MTTRLGTQYQKSKPQPNPTMDPNFEAFIKAMNDQMVTQLTAQINQSNTQTQNQLAQINIRSDQSNTQTQTQLAQLTNQINQMTQSNNQTDRKLS